MRRNTACGVAAIIALLAGASVTLVSCADDTAPPFYPFEAVPFVDLDGASIMFARMNFAYQITRLVVDGSARTVAAKASSVVGVIAPDGASFAYSGLDLDIWLATVDGSNPRRVVQTGAGAPSWSPDGARLLYKTVTTQERLVAIRSVKLDGSDPRVEGEFPVPGPVACPGVEDDMWPVSQASDGRIAFACDGKLYVMPPGLAPELAHDATTDFASLIQSPVWSPDGGRLAFLERQAFSMSLRVLDVAAGTLITLDEQPLPFAGFGTQGHTLCWSPSGQTIIFVGFWRPQVSHIFTVNATSGPARPFTIRPDAVDIGVRCTR